MAHNADDDIALLEQHDRVDSLAAVAAHVLKRQPSIPRPALARARSNDVPEEPQHTIWEDLQPPLPSLRSILESSTDVELTTSPLTVEPHVHFSISDAVDPEPVVPEVPSEVPTGQNESSTDGGSATATASSAPPESLPPPSELPVLPRDSHPGGLVMDSLRSDSSGSIYEGDGPTGRMSI